MVKQKGIYQILNLINNKCYIGQSVDIKNRIYNHFGNLRANIHHNSHLQSSFNKYGEEHFKVNILFSTELEIATEDLNILEETLIRIYNSFHEGYNMNSGGDNKEISDETRKKFSEACKKQELYKKAKSYVESKKKPVRVTNKITGEIKDFETVLDSCKFYNVHSRKAYRVLKGIRKSTKDLIFEYLPKTIIE